MEILVCEINIFIMDKHYNKTSIKRAYLFCRHQVIIKIPYRIACSGNLVIMPSSYVANIGGQQSLGSELLRLGISDSLAVTPFTRHAQEVVKWSAPVN